MRSIYQLSKSDLTEYFLSNGFKKYRASQVWEGLYKHSYQSWDDFTNLPKNIRQSLSEKYSISPLEYTSDSWSDDRMTRKVLFKLNDGYFVETVHLQSAGRHTICISTQSGCPVGCVFCATGALGFFRNLSSIEIFSQATYFSDSLRKTEDKVTNIVLMGMGEPFLNYDEMLQAVKTFNDPERFDIGARRITISTIGIPEGIRKFAEVGKQFNLAISLHASDDALRQQLVPLARKVKIDSIMDAARFYIEKTNRRITYEYVLIDGVNASPGQANQLAGLLKDQNCHINLIALNENDHYPGKPPADKELHDFIGILLSHKIPTTLRNSQGAAIKAGCGQLAGSYNPRKKQ